MPPNTVIAVGASIGGLDALRVLVGGLPADLAAAVFVVLHIGAHPSELPALLSRAGPLPAVHPDTGDAIQAGHIYVAPPDQHLTIDAGLVRLTRGPRENWARPAIDPLFRSAALAYGAGAIGVILTGALNDGTAGLFEIKARGGTTIVQDPAEAMNPDMPRSALAHVVIDHCLTLAGMPPLLTRLAAQAGRAEETAAPFVVREPEMSAEFTHDQPVALTCPDCGGALRRTSLGTLRQFRCHIGHVYTAEVMLEAQFVTLERTLEAATRALGERGELCRQMGESAGAAGDRPARDRWMAAEDVARRQAEALKALLERGVDAS